MGLMCCGLTDGSQIETYEGSSMFLGKILNMWEKLERDLAHTLLGNTHTLRDHAGVVAATSCPTPRTDLQSLPKGEASLV